MRISQPTPPRLVEKDGSVAYGAYRTPFRQANLLDAPVYQVSVPRFWKNFRLKEWQHFAIITPSHYFGMVIFDAKFLGASFFYVFDRGGGQLIEHARQSSGRKTVIASQVYDDFCLFEAAGYRLRVENKLDKGYHRIEVDIASGAKRPSVKGELTIYENLDKVEPLVQVSRINDGRPLYTHKFISPASGLIRVGDTDIRVDQDQSIGLFDEQKTYYPYVSFWKWATGAGFADDGKIAGFNLCQNMIADDAENNENCYWMDGKIRLLSDARFSYDDVMKPWTVRTQDAAIDLTFAPQGERAKKISLAGGLILSDFHQPVGLFNGSLTDEKGNTHAIRNYFGLTEHHVTRY